MFIDVIKRQMNIDSVDAVFHKMHYICMTKRVPKYNAAFFGIQRCSKIETRLFQSKQQPKPQDVNCSLRHRVRDAWCGARN